MGAKQTKIEGSYLPQTPIPSPPVVMKKISTAPAELKQLLPSRSEVEELDPRSPSGCRTPINEIFSDRNTTTCAPTTSAAAATYQQNTPINFTEKPLGMLRKRFLKGFVYNLNDPRSPTIQLNRTPLVFDEAIDKTLNLDDTFADLFVDPCVTTTETPLFAPVSITTIEPEITEKNAKPASDEQQSFEFEMQVEEMSSNSKEVSVTAEHLLEATYSTDVYSEEETMQCPAILRQTPQALQTIDPRSPTIGVERTPIIFTYEDEAGEDAMLENILATLSLDLSNASSVVSFGTPSSTPSMETTPTPKLYKATNKHLERVRAGKKRLPLRKFTRGQRQRIREECENAHNTPKQNTSPPFESETNVDSNHKRTPLSCVKNRSNMRSRSVETASVKTLKARLSLTSYDDTLNPMQNTKVTNLRIMQDSQEQLQ